MKDDEKFYSTAHTNIMLETLMLSSKIKNYILDRVKSGKITNVQFVNFTMAADLAIQHISNVVDIIEAAVNANTNSESEE